MSAKLITSKIWQIISAAAKGTKRPAHVAVAYFGNGAAKLLPLPKGSRLVVDASIPRVKSGLTCPAELKKLHKKGVLIYSVQNLHAKLFVFGSKAFVGSTNVSNNSAGTLVEAVISTTNKKAISDAKGFVQSLCLHELGPEAIDSLAKLYNPPRFSPQGKAKPDGETPVDEPIFSRVLLAQLNRDDPPPGSEKTQKTGLQKAKKEMKQPRRHTLDDFWHKGNCSYRLGDIVIQVVDEGDDRRMVSPPATIVHLEPWQDKKNKYTFAYLEMPNKKRMNFEKLASKLGKGTKKKLKKNGKVSSSFALNLMKAWTNL